MKHIRHSCNSIESSFVWAPCIVQDTNFKLESNQDLIKGRSKT